MIPIRANFSGNVEQGLDKLEERIKQQVIRAAASKMSAVIADEVRSNAERHRKTGTLVNSIYRVYSPERSDDQVKTYRVSWNKRKAQHGHLLEYGTSRAPAYPFVRPAVSKLPDAIQAGLRRMAERLRELSK